MCRMVSVCTSAANGSEASATSAASATPRRKEGYINRYCSYHGAGMFGRTGQGTSGMRGLRVVVVALAAVCLAAAQGAPVVFDTDMGNDVDDALALAVLHALESRGECRLIAVTITK